MKNTERFAIETHYGIYGKYDYFIGLNEPVNLDKCFLSHEEADEYGKECCERYHVIRADLCSKTFCGSDCFVHRPKNPYNWKRQEEIPTFIGGDKIKDKRDKTERIFRIVSRIAYEDTELITLREVDHDENVITERADKIVQHLMMITPAGFYGGKSSIPSWKNN